MPRAALYRRALLHAESGDFWRWAGGWCMDRLGERYHAARALRFLLENPTEPGGSLSARERWLFACRSTQEVLPVQLLEAGESMHLLRVGAEELFWPAHWPRPGLGWTYQECFAPFWRNPHAYETPWFRIAPGDWVLDLGACEGFFSIVALRRGARVVALEPLAEAAGCLGATFRRLGCESRASVLNCLAGQCDGEAHLRIAPSPDCSQSSQEGVAIRRRSLDSLFESGAFPRVDFLKLDIEGDEQAALLGARGVIRRFRPRVAAAVYHSPEQAEEVRRILLSIDPGYRVTTRGVAFSPPPAGRRPMMLLASPR